MRKISYFLMALLSLIIGINRVYASSYNGKLYEVWHPDSGFTVFAEESNGYMDYNSWMIKSTADDKIYYCIDPATPLEGSSSGSHNIYTDKDEIISKTDLTEEKYNEIESLIVNSFDEDANSERVNISKTDEKIKMVLTSINDMESNET